MHLPKAFGDGARGRWGVAGEGKMNHGLVCFEGDKIGSRLWWTAMNKGQFVALYAARAFADGTARRAQPWRESFVPTGGGPLMAGGDEYGRYEPDYDEPFLSMCSASYNRFPAVAVPRDAASEDALSCLAAFDAIAPDLRRLLFDGLGDTRPRADRRLGDLVKALVPLRCEWAFLLGFFYPRPITVLLANDVADLQAFESVDPDRYYFSVVERW